MKMKNPDYGIDAPKVIFYLYIAGFLSFLVAFFLPPFVWFGTVTAGITSFILVAEASLMLLYSKIGKFKHRDRILNLINWRGDETVLDVGTGLGLLMNGAAKHLTTGKVLGIDIWNKADLSNNNEKQTKFNAEKEGVTDRIEIKNQNIISNTLNDVQFDIVMSNLCLHNISTKQERQKACREIHRILKPNGTAIISDFKNTNDYSREFVQSGMTIEKYGPYWIDTFPPLTIIKATKK